MNVDEDAKFPWLKDERALIEAFMKSEKRILGLCLGAQLCAQVLGAPVYPHPKGWELGWWDIELQPTPSLAGFEEPAKLSVLHSHRYVFEAPQGSTLLAKNPWWENQGYLWNRQVMGFQFHPEAELDWNRECALDTDIPRGGQAQVAEEVLRLGELHQPQAARWFHRVLDGFFLNKVRFDRSL
jgi:GMP synthase-like glutamine amidotransferase